MASRLLRGPLETSLRCTGHVAGRHSFSTVSVGSCQDQGMCQAVHTFRTVSKGPVRNPNQPLSFLVMVSAAASVADCTAAPADAAASVTPSGSVAAATSASVIIDTVSFAAKWSSAEGPLHPQLH